MSRKVAWGAPLGAALLGALLIGITLYKGNATPEKALQGMALLVVVCVALFVLQFRSETARVLAGDTIDERWATIHRNALAAAASLSVVVGCAAYVVEELAGRENWQFAFMIVATAVLYLAALAWYRRRI